MKTIVNIASTIPALCMALVLPIMGQQPMEQPTARLTFLPHQETKLAPLAFELKEDRLVLRLHDGIIIEKPRADRFDTALTATWKKSESGFLYSMEIDNRHVESIFIDRDNRLIDDKHTWPEGWIGAGGMWMPADFDMFTGTAPKASRNTRAPYSIESAFLPGPTAVYLQDANGYGPTDMPNRVMRPEEQEAWAELAGYEHNSVRYLIIGPAIAPDADEHDLRNLAVRWVQKYGLTFLQPIVDSGVSASAIESLHPSTDYEREIVSCLRIALAQISR